MESRGEVNWEGTVTQRSNELWLWCFIIYFSIPISHPTTQSCRIPEMHRSADACKAPDQRWGQVRCRILQGGHVPPGVKSHLPLSISQLLRGQMYLLSHTPPEFLALSICTYKREQRGVQLYQQASRKELFKAILFSGMKRNAVCRSGRGKLCGEGTETCTTWIIMQK